MIKTNNPILQKNIKAENQAIKAAEAKAEAERKKNEELQKQLKEKQPTKSVGKDKVNVIVKNNMKSNKHKPLIVRMIGWILNVAIVSIIATTFALILYKYVAIPIWNINYGDLPPFMDKWADTVVIAITWLWERIKEIFSGITTTNEIKEVIQ